MLSNAYFCNFLHRALPFKFILRLIVTLNLSFLQSYHTIWSYITLLCATDLTWHVELNLKCGLRHVTLVLIFWWHKFSMTSITYYSLVFVTLFLFIFSLFILFDLNFLIILFQRTFLGDLFSRNLIKRWVLGWRLILLGFLLCVFIFYNSIQPQNRNFLSLFSLFIIHLRYLNID